METWAKVAALSAGGVLGVNARYWLGVWVVRRVGADLPWATFLINVSGSLAIGFLATLLAGRASEAGARLFVLVGFLGGYTTFSSFTLEALALWSRGDRGPALAYVVGSVAAGLAAVTLGVILARGLMPPAPDRVGVGPPPRWSADPVDLDDA